MRVLLSSLHRQREQSWVPDIRNTPLGSTARHVIVQVGNHGVHEFPCPVAQEADASVIMDGDGERLVWMSHYLVDLGWVAASPRLQREEGTLSLQIIQDYVARVEGGHDVGTLSAGDGH